MNCIMFCYITISLAARSLILFASAYSTRGSNQTVTTTDLQIQTQLTSTTETKSSTTEAPLLSFIVPEKERAELLSVVVAFAIYNNYGSVKIRGVGSPVAEWFAGLPGEVSLDLVDANVGYAVSVVEELVSFWFFQDDDSDDVPLAIFESASGDISDSVGTRYVVEAQGLPPAPVAETTTTTSSSSTASTTAFLAPETSKIHSVTASSITTTSPATTVTTSTVADSPVILQVQVLNGSGVAGVAGRVTEKLSQADTPQRYISSDVSFAEGRQAKAEDTLQTEEIGEIDQPISMPRSSPDKIKSNLLSVFDVRGFFVYNYFYSISALEVQL